MDFLKSHTDLNFRSDIISTKIKNEYNEETDFLTGDRVVYVQTDFSPVFPEEATIGDVPCRIWHYTQTLQCRRCMQSGHRAYEHDKCEAYNPPLDDVTIFWETHDPLSNFYMCKIKMYGKIFRNSEQIYQWCKLRFIERNDLAAEVLRCKTAKEVKKTFQTKFHTMNS